MSETISQLQQALTAHKEAMAELLKLLEREQRTILEHDLAGLDAHGESKRRLLVSLETAANSCRQLIHRAAAELKTPSAANLSALLPYLPLRQRPVLQNLQRHLTETGNTLNRQLTLNRELLQGNLKAVNSSLQFFNNLLSRQTTYGEQGRMVAGGSGIRLVCKEI